MENNIREAETIVKQREQAVRSREEALVHREEAIRQREDLVEQREEASIYKELEAERLRSDLDSELQVAKEKIEILSNHAEDQATRYRAFEKCVQEADRLKVLTTEHARKLTVAAAATGPSDLPSAATKQPEESLRFTLKRRYEQLLGPSYEETPKRSPRPPKWTRMSSTTSSSRSDRQTSSTIRLQPSPEHSSPQPSSSTKRSCKKQPVGKAAPEALDLTNAIIARMQLPEDWTEDDMSIMEARIRSVLHTTATDELRNPLNALEWCANHRANTCWYQKTSQRGSIVESDTGELCTGCQKTNKSLCINVTFIDGQQGTDFDLNDSCKRWAVEKRGKRIKTED